MHQKNRILNFITALFRAINYITGEIMRTIKVYLINKNQKVNTIITDINGSRESIREYYIGKYFNLGIDNDNMYKAFYIDFY